MGKTELEVSEIGFGVWTLASGHWGTFTDDQAVDLLRKAYDAGINYFDVAPTDGIGSGLLADVDSQVVGRDPRATRIFVRGRAPAALPRRRDGREPRGLADARG